MGKGRLAKILGLAVLLSGASFIFGWVCRIVQGECQAHLSASAGFVRSILWFLAAAFALMVAVGLVAALIRPLWASWLACLVSSLTMLLGWRMVPASAIVVAVYLLASLFHVWRVAVELEERIHFSMRALSEGRFLLTIALVAMAAASIYFGAAAYIEREGLSIPPSLKETLLKAIESQVQAQFQAQPDMPAEQKERALADFRREIEEKWIGPVESKLRAYQRFVPPLLALSIFSPLVLVLRLFAWIPNLVIRVLLLLLRLTKVVKVAKETREVERLSLG